MKNKRIDHKTNITSKCHCIFTENFTALKRAVYKLETCRNLNLANIRRPYFGDDINVAFIS